MKGCGVALLVLLLVLVVTAYVGWRWYQANVAPTVDVVGSALEDGLGDFVAGADTVGPCYDLEFDGDDVVSTWRDVDCGGSRDVEVFHRWTFRDGSYPGMQALEDEALVTCTAWFEDYVGVPYAESSLRIEWLVPTDTLWSEGRRDGMCTVTAVPGPLVGPVRGSAR